MTHLPDDIRERGIFLAALRYYSDNCEAPLLHSNCPYAIQTQDARGCGDECLDLLAACGDAEDSEGIPIGNNLAIRRMRPERRARRGPSPVSRPFDAREVAIRERELPVSRRSLSSLLVLLTNLLLEPPGAQNVDEKAAEYHEVSLALYRLEIDPARLLKAYFAPQMATAAVIYTMIPLVSDQLPPDWTYFERLQWDDLIFEDGMNWPERLSLMKDNRDLRSRTVVDLMGVHRHKIERWLAGLDPDELLNWKRPTAVEYGALSDKATEDTDEVYTWLVERFVGTYPGQWTTSSLHLEWKYLHGDIPAPCLSSTMRQRQIDEATVAKLVAERAVHPRADRGLGSSPLLGSKYVNLAVDLLKNGHRQAAFAIMDNAVAGNPAGADGYNNRGFCRMFDDPAAALKDFDEAASLGLGSAPHSLGNRVLALALLGKSAIALEVAEVSWQGQLAGGPHQGWMWSFDGEQRIEEYADLRFYLASLACHVAESSGDSRSENVWRTRLAALEEATR